MSSKEEIKIENDFTLFKFLNESSNKTIVNQNINKGLIQFHFCIKGSGSFEFSQGNYTIDLHDEKSFLFYNPQKELPICLTLEPKTWIITVVISLKKLHSLFSTDAENIPFLNQDNNDKKYYKEEDISPSMAIVLNQIIHYNLSQAIKKLYYKGKSYELLSLYFNRSEDPNAEQCPFLLDEENVLKLRKAKEIIINRLADPPSLQELADEVNISLKKLKEGFKEVYGETVFGFLLDYKLEYARQILDSGTYNVNEVGIKIGYSTASHFITAFKKKFGITPKKYLGSKLK